MYAVFIANEITILVIYLHVRDVLNGVYVIYDVFMHCFKFLFEDMLGKLLGCQF